MGQIVNKKIESDDFLAMSNENFYNCILVFVLFMNVKLEGVG
jgi:hypothetical protein